MNRLNRYISILVLCVVIFTVASFATGDSVYSTANDPLVSLSYIEDLKEQIVTELYSRVDSDALADYLRSSSFTFEQLSKGQQLIATGSCEVVLRSGKGTVVILNPVNVAAGVGFSDMTGACEVTNGMSVAKNHLLLASAGDGRLIEVTSDVAYFMVRGDYSVVG
ncbi:MAG: hypothetical protein IJD17_01390 [Clostridia bacterium]|nr:hypothetical protein [Clostridia bacterium]